MILSLTRRVPKSFFDDLKRRLNRIGRSFRLLVLVRVMRATRVMRRQIE
jgi:hypothetical protein